MSEIGEQKRKRRQLKKRKILKGGSELRGKEKAEGKEKEGKAKKRRTTRRYGDMEMEVGRTKRSEILMKISKRRMGFRSR